MPRPGSIEIRGNERCTKKNHESSIERRRTEGKKEKRTTAGTECKKEWNSHARWHLNGRQDNEYDQPARQMKANGKWKNVVQVSKEINMKG